MNSRPEPVFTLTRFGDWLVSFLAAVGVIAMSIAIGLYFAGFFTFLMNRP